MLCCGACCRLGTEAAGLSNDGASQVKKKNIKKSAEGQKFDNGAPADDMEEIDQAGAFVPADEGLVDCGEKLGGFEAEGVHQIVHEAGELFFRHFAEFSLGQFGQSPQGIEECFRDFRRGIAGSAQCETKIFGGMVVHPSPGTFSAGSKSRYVSLGHIAQIFDDGGDVAGMYLEECSEMANLNLTGQVFGYGAHLGEFVDPGVFTLLFPLSALFGCFGVFGLRGDLEVGAFDFVVVFVDFENVEIEADGELGVGTGAGEEEAHHFGLVVPEHVVEGNHFAGGAAHFSAAAFEADEVVFECNGGLVIEDFRGGEFGGVEAAAFGMVLFSGGFEIHAFGGPSHRPVDAPGEFYRAGAPKVYGFGVPAGFAGVGNAVVSFSSVHFRGVPVAGGAEDGQGLPVGGQRGGAVGIQVPPNSFSVVQGGFYAFGVAGGAIMFGLIDVFRENTDFGEYALKGFFIMGGIALLIAENIRDMNDGSAQVLFENILVRHVGGNFAKNIVVVPRVDEAHRAPAVDQGSNHQFNRDDFPEIAEVHRARGGDARCAYVCIFIAAFTNNLVGGDIRPMGGKGSVGHILGHDTRIR